MSKRLLTMAALACSIPCCRAGFAASVEPNRIPIQAELVKAMEAGRVKAGETVFAKVDIAWKDSTCSLRKGAILKGRVVSEVARTKTSRTSDLALLFESGQCGGRDMKPLALTVAALIGPDPSHGSSLYENQENQPLSEAVGQGIGGEGSAGAGPGSQTGNSMRSVLSAAATSFVEPIRYKPPKAVLPGQVIGIAGVQLSVGNGPEGSSVLSSSRHNMRLDEGSQFVLVPSVKTAATGIEPTPTPVASSSASTSSSTARQKALPDVPLPDETDICTPPECGIAVSTSEGQPGTTQAAATLSVKELGYAVRGNREMEGFDYDAALAYLGPKRILFTFNPHLLVHRAPAEASPQLRTVRAVLIDIQTMKVLKTADWRVLDEKQYLWPVGNERALVHVGSELRMYGPGLTVDQRVSLNGPLAFVRVSPSGNYFAVGVVQERHSRTVHEQLAEAEGREPEEDVEVKVLSAEFRVLATVTRSSRDAPPVLSDEGEIRIPTIGKNRWRAVENTWDGQRRVLAQVTSTCKPEATTLQPDLLFLVGCDRQSDGKWYLRSDGKPVLKGWSPSQELEQTANGASGTFAVGVAKADKPIAAEALFRAADLESENIGVYHVENGRRKFAISIASPVPTLQTFVLSPNGDQLAVLQENQIAFYAVSNPAEIHP
ncbi:MAG TPA: hypothetical protein VGN39_04815 [Terriglobales bacterium]|nr:hypothetical protein [Terriglobales bacterium]